MHLVIREATVADAELIAEMSRQTFYETYAQYNAPEDMAQFLREQFTKEALMAEVGAAGNLFLIALSNNEPAGYVRLRETESDSTANKIEIARLYAVTAMIGKGVGKALMQACIDVARKQQKKTIWLCVWPKNGRAVQFYAAWGFEKVGERAFMLGNDVQQDWVLEKQL